MGFNLFSNFVFGHQSTYNQSDSKLYNWINWISSFVYLSRNICLVIPQAKSIGQRMLSNVKIEVSYIYIQLMKVYYGHLRSLTLITLGG